MQPAVTSPSYDSVSADTEAAPQGHSHRRARGVARGIPSHNERVVQRPLAQRKLRMPGGVQVIVTLWIVRVDLAGQLALVLRR